MIRPKLLLSIVTVDKALVRNYDEYLARAMAKEQGARFGKRSLWRWAIGAGRIDHSTRDSRQGCAYIEMESFVGSI